MKTVAIIGCGVIGSQLAGEAARGLVGSASSLGGEKVCTLLRLE